ncbi:heterokaryon incompatibility protein-domain-containing protein [Halenospora varia]|nr:heterokaryon incompatibility protein-domain-containing protein [Halenospora varia]
MNDCRRNHLMCHSRSSSLQPTRLVYVGSTFAPQFRLCIDKNARLDENYVTLSHCWGGNVPKKLLTENMASMIHSIEPTELSKTFREPITVTRELGFQYIWIDSLCIIQDDQHDWQRESILMCQIYTGGSCNICATVRGMEARDCSLRESQHLWCSKLNFNLVNSVI